MTDDARFFRTIAQEAIMGIMAFDPDSGRCTYVNRLACEALEIGMIEGESQIPVKLSDLYPEKSQSRGESRDQQRARAGHARPFSPEFLRHEGMSQDVLLRKKNGLPLIANVGIKHIHFDDGRRSLLVMFQDITIQKKLQREVQIKQQEIHKAYTELLEQNRQLKELDLAKDKFVALTTHELRTPLSAIVATAEVLDLKLYESEQQKTEFIRTIHEQSLHLMELVNDILDFAKIRAGKMEYYIESVDLIPLLRKIAGNHEQMAAQAKVSLKLELPAEMESVYADLLRLREVLDNVVNNAIKYNRAGGSVTLRLEQREGAIQIAVADTGPGIAMDKLKHVFNEFETVGHVSQHHRGTGLGMPISKQLMLAMGGDLTLTSEEGQGSTFFIEIPTRKVLPEEMYRTRPDAWADLAA